jgi:hypothetical protein
MGKDGKFPGLHYEAVAVSLGDLFRSQKDWTNAAGSYELANQVDKPEPEIAQKANLAAGEMYDLMQKRDQAVKNYQTVVNTDGSTSYAETARRRIKDPYRGE